MQASSLSMQVLNVSIHVMKDLNKSASGLQVGHKIWTKHTN